MKTKQQTKKKTVKFVSHDDARRMGQKQNKQKRVTKLSIYDEVDEDEYDEMDYDDDDYNQYDYDKDDNEDYY